MPVSSLVLVCALSSVLAPRVRCFLWLFDPLSFKAPKRPKDVDALNCKKLCFSGAVWSQQLARNLHYDTHTTIGCACTYLRTQMSGPSFRRVDFACVSFSLAGAGFAVVMSFWPPLQGKEYPKKSTGKFTEKNHNKIHALSMKKPRQMLCRRTALTNSRSLIPLCFEMPWPLVE